MLLRVTDDSFSFRRARVKRQVRMVEMLYLVLSEQIDHLGSQSHERVIKRDIDPCEVCLV